MHIILSAPIGSVFSHGLTYPISFLLVAMKTGSDCYQLISESTEGYEGEIQEVTAILAVAKEIAIDVAVADGIFYIKKRTNNCCATRLFVR